MKYNRNEGKQGTRERGEREKVQIKKVGVEMRGKISIEGKSRWPKEKHLRGNKIDVKL